MLRKGIGTMLLLVALAGCNGGDGGGGYPSQVVENFMTSCTAQPGASESECQCAIDRIQETMTLEEFAAEEQRIVRGERPSDEIIAAINECRED
jgi:hypothetical protein